MFAKNVLQLFLKVSHFSCGISSDSMIRFYDSRYCTDLRKESEDNRNLHNLYRD